MAKHEISSSFIVALILLAVPLASACDQKDAAVAVDAAPVSAQTDFQKVRADYLHQKQTDLALLDKGVGALEAREKVAGAKTKADLHGALVSAKAARESFAADLHSAEASTAATWDDAKARLDKEWTDLKAAVDKATTTSVATVRKPATMTCGEFVALADVEKPKVVYWAEGFDKRGMPSGSFVDVGETDRLVPVLVSECTKDPTTPLAKAVQKHGATSPKPSAAAKAPGKMTCQDFVEVDDVVRPKLVYWAEGFDVDGDGGATDSSFDVEETDELVPTLVTECKESPKLTLWQRLMKHL